MSAISTTAMAPPITDEISIGRNSPAGNTVSSATPHTKNASIASTVIMSSTRSITIVAKVAGALRPSCRARRYGRSTSPARAGSTPSAAKPMTVVRNAVRKRVGPIGWSRYRQRQARMT